MMRDTNDQQVDFEKLRKDQLKNFQNFYDVIDNNIMGEDQSAFKDEVKEYVHMSKNYKQNYKNNVQKIQREVSKDNRISSNNGYNMEKDKSSKNGKKKKQINNNGDIWDCDRNNNDQQYKHIPVNEEGIQHYLDSRK